jgi:hypothetical protein
MASIIAQEDTMPKWLAFLALATILVTTVTVLMIVVGSK